MQMATSGELLALTSAVVDPLCTAGHKGKNKDTGKGTVYCHGYCQMHPHKTLYSNSLKRFPN